MFRAAGRPVRHDCHMWCGMHASSRTPACSCGARVHNESTAVVLFLCLCTSTYHAYLFSHAFLVHAYLLEQGLIADRQRPRCSSVSKAWRVAASVLWRPEPKVRGYARVSGVLYGGVLRVRWKHTCVASLRYPATNKRERSFSPQTNKIATSWVPTISLNLKINQL
jgi:hypothetical protein